MWERLTPADVERARGEVERQRTETLARHAEELQFLDLDGAELDSLERAIDSFMRKFAATPITG